MIGFFTYACPILLSITFLFRSETNADPSCANLFYPTKLGVEVLHEKDPRLHTSTAVERASTKYSRKTGTPLKKPIEKLNEWLNNMSRISEYAQVSSNSREKIKTILYEQYVIKPQDMPESYYNLQMRIAYERGEGSNPLTVQQKEKLAAIVIADQKQSLESWIEYFVSKDTNMYPMWLKYWLFSGMTKLSKYDPNTGQFGNRDNQTVTPFAELNHEVLGLVVDSVLKSLNKISLHEIKDPNLQKLLPGLSFGKIYGYILAKIASRSKGEFETNSGQWVIYPRGSDHIPLVKSLEGRNTGWCTAGESTAKYQLDGGDFHVYYSLDQYNNPTIPRIAIRMNGNHIAEVRGVAKDQNLDSQISQSEITSSKLKEFGSIADSYFKKDHDMKLLTQIDAIHRQGKSLTSNEIKFLYEFESKISGFGHNRDPRILEIISKRDLKSDLVLAFEGKYKLEEISTTLQEFLGGKFKVHYGDLDLSAYKTAGDLKLPEILIGSLDLSALNSADGLKLPHSIFGGLTLSRINFAKGLRLPDTLYGYLDLGNLFSAVGLELPKNFYGGLNLGALTSTKGLKLKDIIYGDLILRTIESADGFKFARIVKGDLDLHRLISVKGLKLPDEINGALLLPSLTSLKSLNLTSSLMRYLRLDKLTDETFLKIPDNLRGLDLRNLTSAEGLKLPHSIRVFLFLDRLKSAVGLKKPKGVTTYKGPEDIGE